jgi:hypothetical protein
LHGWSWVHTTPCLSTAFTKCKGKASISRSSSVESDAEIPIIDTSTGHYVALDFQDTVDEVGEEDMYIMQVINLTGNNVIIIFDCSANQRLIDS